MLCHFYVGEVVSCLQKATLIPGGSEGLVYSTLSGSLGILVPFASKDTYTFFQHLELHMRSENVSLVGRDHLHYRSLYHPCKVCLFGGFIVCWRAFLFSQSYGEGVAFV